MKIIKFLLMPVLFVGCCLRVLAGQECIGINFFDPPKTKLQAYTCWDGGKSYVYLGSPATFERCDGAVPVDMSIGTGSLVLESTLPGGWWNIEFKMDWGHSVNFLRYGESPVLYLRLKREQIAPGADMRIELRDDQQIRTLYRTYTGQGDAYSNEEASVYLSDYVSSSSEWQDVYIPMDDFLDDNPNLDLTRISIIKFYGAGYYSQTNILYIEKMKLIPSVGCEYSDMVKVNQLGYLPDEKKLAIVSYETSATAPTFFQVKDELTQAVAYQDNVQLKTAGWDASGDTVYHADFTSLITPGSYYIYLPELGQTSAVFDISAKAFDGPFRDSLRFFYYARSGNEIAEPYSEGHPRPTIYANNSTSEYDYDDNDPTKMYDYDPADTGIETRDVQGGWFDAGDLHLDIHNNITTLWFLLEILEQRKNKLGPGLLNLPESDSQTNDLVLLIKYQLDWFKKMQNSDGSVHFIVIAQSSDKRHQLVSDVSSGAACVLAGIFAKAYPLFCDIPGMESYASDLLTRAELSWSWLESHPNTYNPTGPSGSTWSYGISDDRPYRGFAAIELYLATGDSTYHNYFQNRFSDVLTSFGGNSYYGWISPIGGSAISKGYMDYVEETNRSVNESIRTAIKNAFIAEANELADNATTSASTYRIPMLMFNDLYWGSSGLLCGNAYVLLRAYEWTGQLLYREVAMDVLDWIGGRNPVSRVFITGYGDYLHGTDHYSFYMFDHLNPVPGYLCGNINHHLGFLGYYIQYSWKCYLNIQNAGILEPCIHWQAQMCYLLSYFASDLNMTADIYPDGTVDSLDLLELSDAWLSVPGNPNWNPNCDITIPDDNHIDFYDFAAFSSQWMNHQ